MHKRSTDLIVGIVIIISLVTLISGVRFLKESKGERNFYDINVLFSNVGTLTEGDPVKVNGVKKGKVKKIELSEQTVVVTMSIDKKIALTHDSKVVIQNIGLMGERMIGIQLGNGAPVKPGEVMNGAFDSGIAEAMGMLGEVLTQVQTTVNELRDIVKNTVGNQEFQTTFNEMIERLNRTTQTLDALVSENKSALQGSINDLSGTAGDVREFMSNNKTKLNSAVSNVEEITDKGKILLMRADSISRNLEELVARLNSDRSSLGKLLNDTAFVNNIRATIVSADSLVKQVQKKGIKVGFW